MSKITKFTGQYEFLSNFYPCFANDKTVEHYFQAAKTAIGEEQAAILKSATPGEAKKLGRQCSLIRNWDQIKDSIMMNLLRRKFQDLELARKLMYTYPNELIEGNTWGDTYWGVSHGKGENKLGKMLMQIRDEMIKNLGKI